jgi:hypothetical protein
MTNEIDEKFPNITRSNLLAAADVRRVFEISHEMDRAERIGNLDSRVGFEIREASDGRVALYFPDRVVNNRFYKLLRRHFASMKP